MMANIIGVTHIFAFKVRKYNYFSILQGKGCRQPHHDRKTLEFEADSESNNVTLNNREHFALKNLGSGVQATISAIGNRKIRTCTMECYKVSRKYMNNRRNEGNSCWSIFSFSFCKFLHNATYKIILFCHRLGREIS